MIGIISLCITLVQKQKKQPNKSLMFSEYEHVSIADIST